MREPQVFFKYIDLAKILLLHAHRVYTNVFLGGIL